MFNIDIAELPKNNFKAFNFKDGSIYYGETSHLDQNGNIMSDLDKVDETTKKTLKLIRHGNGVQIYGVDGENFLSKYEGQWNKDKRSGLGICYFSDKSVYEGSLINGMFHGSGKFTWSNNDIYIGEWKFNKMDGRGEFKPHEGNILKGVFKSNYFKDERIDKHRNRRIVFLNPFKDKQSDTERYDYSHFINKKFKISDSQDQFFFEVKYSDGNHFQEIIDYIITEQDKTPLILKSSKISKNDIIKLYKQTFNTEIYELDLRKFHAEVEGTTYKKDLINIFEKNIEYTVFNGFTLFLNYDDNKEYEKLFDPPLVNYYKKMQLSPKMFIPSDFKNPESFKIFSRQENIRNRDKLINQNFKFVIYSKLHILDIFEDEKKVKVKELQELEKSSILINNKISEPEKNNKNAKDTKDTKDKDNKKGNTKNNNNLNTNSNINTNTQPEETDPSLKFKFNEEDKLQIIKKIIDFRYGGKLDLNNITVVLVYDG